MAKKKLDLARKIYSQKSLNRMQARVDLLGYKNSYNAIIFMNIRLLTSAFLFFMVIYLFSWGYVGAPVLTFVYYVMLPKVFIDRKVEERRRILDSDAMYFFEVLTLSLESGRNLKQALSITSSNIESELSDEFNQSLKSINYGKSLDEALDELKRRIPSDTINNIILNIKESNIFGSSIIETLHNQIDYITDKKILETKAQISKIPLKISVISVIFFIPLLLLLILAPVIIGYLT